MRQVQEMTYFTNLPKEEFEKRKMEALYSKRLDIEVAYKTLKTQLKHVKKCIKSLCKIYHFFEIVMYYDYRVIFNYGLVVFITPLMVFTVGKFRSSSVKRV